MESKRTAYQEGRRAYATAPAKAPASYTRSLARDASPRWVRAYYLGMAREARS